MDMLSYRLFLRVADLGSITAAAQDLSLSPASASARLAKLESEVGFRLFNRTTRAVTLTSDGADFLPYVQEAMETLAAGLGTVSGRGQVPKGLLRMTMPGSFGRMYIIPRMREFRSRHPEVELDLRLSDEVLDVVQGAFDLIIRNAPLQDSNFVARPLAKDKRILVASPEYIEQRGMPETPETLRDHECLGFPDRSAWEFESAGPIAVKLPIVVNDGEAMRQIIEAGGGIGVKSLWNAAPSLRSGTLVQVLASHPLITRSAIWMVYPSGRMISPKVRAMVAFLEEQFSPLPPWET